MLIKKKSESNFKYFRMAVNGGSNLVFLGQNCSHPRVDSMALVLRGHAAAVLLSAGSRFTNYTAQSNTS